MSCRRAFEIDLAGFLEDSRADAFADFRDHYPRCPECSAELGAWSELELQLRARGLAQHPDPEHLARFPGGVDAHERARVERHLADCAACRDELRGLEAFVPASLPGASARAGATSGSRVRAGWAQLGRLAWSPGFAYAALALVLIPTIYDALDSEPVVFSDSWSPSVQSEMGVPAFGAKDDVEQRIRAARKPAARAPAPARELAEMKLESAPAAVEELRLAADLDLQESEARAAGAGIARPEPPSPMQNAAPVAGYAAPAHKELRTDAPGAGLLSRSSALGRSSPEPVRLSEDSPVEIDAAIAARGFRLTAPLPRGLASGEIEIRVSDAASRRELLERIRIAPGQTQAELEVPARWMVAGTYLVTIRELRAPEDEVSPAVYVLRLVNRAP